MKSTYQRITEQVIKAIEAGDVLPWRKPWAVRRPCNAVTNRPYRGINRLMLSMSEYGDHRWLTFNQARALSGSIRKGERGSTVMLYSDVEDEATGKERLICRAFTVFNVEQCIGLDLPSGSLLQSQAGGLEAAERIVAGYKDCPELHFGTEQAAYYPVRDAVVVPHMRDFETPEAFYGTLYHELIHSTSHPSRLGRISLEAGINFGSEEYIREEVLAEIGSAFLASEALIENLSPTTSYINSWLTKALNSDSSLIIKAASGAQKAVDWILGDGHHDDSPEPEPRLTGELVAR